MLVIFGGALLLTPGFITDILGLVLLIPPTRALVRGIARRAGSRTGWSRRRPARARRRATRRRGHRRRRRRRADRAAPGGALTDKSAERARHPTEPGFADAVTFSFADPAAGLYGLARPVLVRRRHRERDRRAVRRRRARGAVAEAGVRTDAGFEHLDLPGLQTTVQEPLQTWTVRLDAGEHGFELTFEAPAPPAELDAAEPAARAGGLEGYEQLCRVHGTVWLGERTHEVRCRGQRGHSWGEPDWDGDRRLRASLGAWLDDGTGVVLRAVRPAGRTAHGDEALWAAVLGSAGSLRVDDPRLSTTYDDDGRQLRAGLELWVGEDDDHPRRVVGEVLCGSTLELGPLRLRVRVLALADRRAVGRRPLRPAAPRMIQAVVSDFGGVLTSPLLQAFNRVQDDIGVPIEALGAAMAYSLEHDGEHPLYVARARRDHRGGVPRRARPRARGRARPPRRAARLRRAADGRAASPTRSCSTTTARCDGSAACASRC